MKNDVRNIADVGNVLLRIRAIKNAFSIIRTLIRYVHDVNGG